MLVIVKCSHCNQILSSEDFDSHECDLPLKGCKRIEVVYFHDDSYKDKRLMSGWGIDGILYTLEVVSRKAIPMTIPLSRRFLTDKKTDEDLTESSLAKAIKDWYRKLKPVELTRVLI